MNNRTAPQRYPSELNTWFEVLEDLLYGYNYQVFLRHYFDPDSNLNTPFVDTLRAVLEKKEVEVGGSAAESLSEVIAEVKRCLTYKGDDTCGPISERISSGKFVEALDMILKHIEKLCASCSNIAGIYIKEGHPAYPVYWNFAWLLQSESGCHVLIGSSSD